MKSRRRAAMLALLAVILVAIALRYPLVEHERFQTDSYFFHYLSGSIVDEGRAKWTVHPLSYAGYYPSSYPSGNPFLLAETSMLTGTSIEAAILMFNMMLGILFALVVFCLAREFVHGIWMVILASLLATLAPRFVDTTYWDGSARGLAVVLMTLLVLVATRTSVSRPKTAVLLVCVLIFASFSVHHMAVLTIMYGLGFLIAYVGVRYIFRMLRGRLPSITVTAFVCSSVVAMTASVVLFGALNDDFVETAAESGFFDVNPPLLSATLNFGVSYVHQVGFVLILAVLGIVSIFRDRYFTLRRVFVAAMLLAFIPVLASSLYVSMLVVPFAAVLGSIWLSRTERRVKSKSALRVFIVIFIGLSLAFSVWSVDRWNVSEYPTEDNVEVSHQVFNDAVYLSFVAPDEYAVGTGEVLAWQLEALSDAKFLRSGVPLLINGDLSKEEIRGNMTNLEASFPWNLYIWTDYKDRYFVDTFVHALVVAGVSVADGEKKYNQRFVEYATSHPRLVVVIDNNWPSEFATMYGPYDSVLQDELWQARQTYPPIREIPSYMLFSSERSTFFLVQLPV